MTLIGHEQSLDSIWLKGRTKTKVNNALDSKKTRRQSNRLMTLPNKQAEPLC